MTDRYGRNINYARISLTQGCNFSCVYCCTGSGTVSSEELPATKIVEYARALAEAGIEFIKLTGGEPLMRADVCEIAASINALPHIREVTLTTNGFLLEQYVPSLKKAGINKINVSLDALNPNVFLGITGNDAVDRIIKGIDSACDAGIEIKLNTVILKNINESEIIPLTKFAAERKICIRFIECMPIGAVHQWVPAKKVKAIIDSHFKNPRLSDKSGNGPAVYYKYENSDSEIGFISAVSNTFCADCNRIRLTCDGILKPCLCYEDGIRIDDCSDSVKAVKEAILSKPSGHNFNTKTYTHFSMKEFGG